MHDNENFDYGNGMIELDPVDDPGVQRRDLLRGAGTLAALVASAGNAAAQPAADRVPEAKAGPLLPLVSFGKHKITRLVAGANPIYAYYHFNYVFSAAM